MTRTSFQALPRLLKPNGAFVLSITHPAFNNASTVHVLEEVDDEEEIKTIYLVKTSRYMTHFHAKGVALRNQPRPQMYFERPLQYYLNLGFQNGFVLDGFEERAFPPDHPQISPLRGEASSARFPQCWLRVFVKDRSGDSAKRPVDQSLKRND